MAGATPPRARAGDWHTLAMDPAPRSRPLRATRRGVVPALIVAISLVIVAAPACPAQAQQAGRVYRLGLLSLGPSRGGDARADPNRAALLARLQELGYSEGRNLRVEARRADGDLDRLPALAAELVAEKVDVIVAGGSPAVDAARRTTRTIPIVMLSADPVALGFVRSLSRPEGNLTGLSTDAGLEVWGKRLQLLKEAAPTARRVAVLTRTGGQEGAWVPLLDRAAQQLGLVLVHAGARRSDDLTAAFVALSAQRPDALFASDTPLMFQYRRSIIEFAARHRLPDMHGYREAAQDGALISYGADIVAAFRQAASYVDRLLKGARPADLPIEQPARFELVINRRTARALGLDIPPSLLLRADQVIE